MDCEVQSLFGMKLIISSMAANFCPNFLSDWTNDSPWVLFVNLLYEKKTKQNPKWNQIACFGNLNQAKQALIKRFSSIVKEKNRQQKEYLLFYLNSDECEELPQSEIKKCVMHNELGKVPPDTFFHIFKCAATTFFTFNWIRTRAEKLHV